MDTFASISSLILKSQKFLPRNFSSRLPPARAPKLILLSACSFHIRSELIFPSRFRPRRPFLFVFRVPARFCFPRSFRFHIFSQHSFVFRFPLFLFCVRLYSWFFIAPSLWGSCSSLRCRRPCLFLRCKTAILASCNHASSGLPIIFME
jgi:hypothetical protein